MQIALEQMCEQQPAGRPLGQAVPEAAHGKVLVELLVVVELLVLVEVVVVTQAPNC